MATNLDGMTKSMLVEILRRGPQTAQPPRLTQQAKSDLLRSIRSALRLPEGSPARVAMEQVIIEIQRENQ